MFSEVGQRNHVFSPSFILAKRARSYYCWKFHFWSYNGYSDLSAVEETVGKGRGEWESENIRGKNAVHHMEL